MDQNSAKDQTKDQTPATPKQQAVDRIKSANNVLVTVKSNPSVDELAATIGLTIMLNKLGKHATAVFSGEVPSTLEFLKPEETIETNTDSLRDFIVSLDKSKADKLRYKVEENVVKIFITPYRTSITQDDLEFTQGDFNVDAVLALGVTQREELDQAITTHGRILHDATVVTITAGQDFSELGQINWQEQGASSLSEMLVSISEALQGGIIDEQIATAFLTGIVAETERFSNPKTTPKVMTMAAQLMAAGANQQLIANELEKTVEVDMSALTPETPMDMPTEQPAPVADDAGTLSIAHEETPVQERPVPDMPAENQPALDQPMEPESQQEASAEEEKKEGLPRISDIDLETKSIDEVDEDGNQIHIDVEGNLMRKTAAEPKHKVIQPLAASEPEPVSAPVQEQPAVASEAPEPTPTIASESTLPEPVTPTPTSGAPVSEAPAPSRGVLPPPPKLDLTPSGPIPDNTTLAQLEAAVDSPHVKQQISNIDSARDAIAAAHSQMPFDPANNARGDIGGLPLGMPPEQSSYDSFRLPDASPSTPPVTDVSGNLPSDFAAPETPPTPSAPTFTLPGQESSQDNSQMAPPPVPPPFTGL